MLSVIVHHLLAFVVGFFILGTFVYVFAVVRTERVAFGFLAVTAYLVGLSVLGWLASV